MDTQEGKPGPEEGDELESALDLEPRGDFWVPGPHFLTHRLGLLGGPIRAYLQQHWEAMGGGRASEDLEPADGVLRD